MFAINNTPKIVGVVLPKKWSGQNLTDLNSDYGPEMYYEYGIGNGRFWKCIFLTVSRLPSYNLRTISRMEKGKTSLLSANIR